MYDTWHQMRRYLTAGLLDPRPVITHQFPLAKIDEALAAIRAGDAGKIILQIARRSEPGSRPSWSSSSATACTSGSTTSMRRKPQEPGCKDGARWRSFPGTLT